MSHRIFICFCKGFFRDDNSDALYELLDIDRRATPADIKRAYRSKSLLMHPDKINQRGQEVTDEDRANFQKMKNAYDVLSDPKKRELYDQLGETGMLMMEDPFAAKDNMMKNFLRMGTRDRLRLVLFVVLFVGAILLWPILFCVKVDGETSASWVALWTPLWVYDALGLWYFMYLVSLGKIEPPEGMEDDWKDPFPLPMRVLALFKWVLLILFQIFVAMRLDGDIDWSYAIVGSPLLAWIGLQLLAHIYEASRPIPADRVEESILHEEEGSVKPDAEIRQQAIAKRTEARRAVVQDCLWGVQLVFLIMKLDDEVDWSWWVVFLPTWVVLIGQLTGYCLDYTLARRLATGLEGKDEDELTEEERTRVAAASQLIANAMASCCCWGCTFVSIILAVNAIAGANYSAFVIFIPQFTIAGLIVCCMTCVICCVRALPGEDLDHLVNPDVEQGGVGGTYAPPNVSEGAGVNPSGPEATSGAATTVVIMPPVPSAAVVGGEGSISAPSIDMRPLPASTPAPDFQADGGID